MADFREPEPPRDDVTSDTESSTTPPPITSSANEDEARRALALARAAISTRDVGRATRLLRRSLALFPLPAAAAELRAVTTAAAADRERGAGSPLPDRTPTSDAAACAACGHSNCVCGARARAGAAGGASTAAAAATAATAPVRAQAMETPHAAATVAAYLSTAWAALGGAARVGGRGTRRAWTAWRAAFARHVTPAAATPLAALWLAIAALAVMRVVVGAPLLGWVLAEPPTDDWSGGGGSGNRSRHHTLWSAPSSFALSLGLSLVANVAIALARAPIGWRWGAAGGGPAARGAARPDDARRPGPPAAPGRRGQGQRSL